MTVSFVTSKDEYSFIEVKYANLLKESSNTIEWEEKWLIARPDYKKLMTQQGLGDIVHIETEGTTKSLLYKHYKPTDNTLPSSDIIVYIKLHLKSVSVKVLGPTIEKIEEHIKFLKEIYPEQDKLDEGKVAINFWYQTKHGARTVNRVVDVPRWNAIDQNYETDTQSGLQYLMNFKPQDGGQLIIWTGVPGTGKTYALRSLLNEWKDWCSGEYILDPEVLFGDSAYLSDFIVGSEPDEDEDEDDKWKLLILEDSGELLTKDSKSRTGQGVSRLLNLVDGLIGQGLKLLVLITSNEELGDFHPAVIRQGRCIATIQFNQFSKEAAARWLDGKKVKLTQQEYTLAELYAIGKPKNMFNGEDIKQFGFRSLNVHDSGSKLGSPKHIKELIKELS